MTTLAEIVACVRSVMEMATGACPPLSAITAARSAVIDEIMARATQTESAPG